MATGTNKRGTGNRDDATAGKSADESATGTPVSRSASRPACALPATGAGVLYLVATPIGNLGDIGTRALDVLRSVDSVLAEDTRRTQRLLHAYGISTVLEPLHDFNERQLARKVGDRVQAGERLALVSDAGTPLVSDPGFRLVRELGRRGLAVSPIPGPSALLAALCASGLPTDRFVFEGFPPSRAAARRQRFDALREEPRTMVLFEAPHRIRDTLADLRDAFGGERPASMSRELTKRFETVLRGTLAEIAAAVAADPDQRRGEIALVVAGCPSSGPEDVGQSDALLIALAQELPIAQAARVAARVTGLGRNALYARALALTRGRAGAARPRADDG